MARKELRENELIEDDRLHYQVLVGDIRESKADQWRISNYGLLAQAAVASVFSSWNLWFLALSLIIYCSAVYLIWDAWGRIKKCRETSENYPPPYNDPLNPLSPRRDWPIIGLFLGAQAIGFIVSGTYLFFKTYPH